MNNITNRMILREVNLLLLKEERKILLGKERKLLEAKARRVLMEEGWTDTLSDWFKDWGHLTLDVIALTSSFVPGWGTAISMAADLSNAVWYYSQGHEYIAALYVIMSIPFVGDLLAIPIQMFLKLGKGAGLMAIKGMPKALEYLTKNAPAIIKHAKKLGGSKATIGVAKATETLVAKVEGKSSVEAAKIIENGVSKEVIGTPKFTTEGVEKLANTKKGRRAVERAKKQQANKAGGEAAVKAGEEVVTAVPMKLTAQVDDAAKISSQAADLVRNAKTNVERLSAARRASEASRIATKEAEIAVKESKIASTAAAKEGATVAEKSLAKGAEEVAFNATKIAREAERVAAKSSRFLVKRVIPTAAGYLATNSGGSTSPDAEEEKEKEKEKEGGGGGGGGKKCSDNKLKYGCTGQNVKFLQQRLLDLGYKLPRKGVDGWFGPETKAAVVSFQTDNGLKPDGVVGPKTAESLKSSTNKKDNPPSPTPSPVKPREREGYKAVEGGGLTADKGLSSDQLPDGGIVSDYDPNSSTGPKAKSGVPDEDDIETAIRRAKPIKEQKTNQLMTKRNRQLEKLMFERLVRNAN